jgi:hypothetical protein
MQLCSIFLLRRILTRGQIDLLNIERSTWHQKKCVALSDMLRALHMVIWRGNLISWKGKITSFVENMTPGIADWAADIMRRVIQAA